jgi:hypothetical protein
VLEREIVREGVEIECRPLQAPLQQKLTFLNVRAKVEGVKKVRASFANDMFYLSKNETILKGSYYCDDVKLCANVVLIFNTL